MKAIQEEGRSPAGTCLWCPRATLGVFLHRGWARAGSGFFPESTFISPLALLAGVSCYSGQKKRRKDKKKPSPTEPPGAIDKSYLCCEHHKAMVAGLCLLGGPDALPGDEASSGRLCWGRCPHTTAPWGKALLAKVPRAPFPKRFGDCGWDEQWGYGILVAHRVLLVGRRAGSAGGGARRGQPAPLRP